MIFKTIDVDKDADDNVDDTKFAWYCCLVVCLRQRRRAR